MAVLKFFVIFLLLIASFSSNAPLFFKESKIQHMNFKNNEENFYKSEGKALPIAYKPKNIMTL